MRIVVCYSYVGWSRSPAVESVEGVGSKAVNLKALLTASYTVDRRVIDVVRRSHLRRSKDRVSNRLVYRRNAGRVA